MTTPDVTAERARLPLHARVRATLTSAPAYEPSAADLRTVTIAGLTMPLRSTIVVLVVVTVVSLDWSRTFIPRAILDLNRAPEALLYQAVERLVLFGLLPLAVIVLAFRDDPARYGLRLGDWRVGAPLAAIGVTLMAPVIFVLAAQPEFRAFYGPSVASPPFLLLTNLVDLPPTEFLMRGFLMFALLRTIGPLALVVATLPFVFSHLSKPEIELLSTFFGGLVYGWLDWRTGSIVWSAAAHVTLVTLLLVAVGGARLA
jgi:membrane protease YdiL (CAAX protease family)